MGKSLPTRENEHERYHLLRQLEEWLDGPVLVLGFIWLILLIIEFTGGENRTVEFLGTVIWVIFIVDFVLRFVLAPRKLPFLKENWLNAISLAVPALRVLRIFRASGVLRLAQASKGVRLVKVVGSLNRGMLALKRSMSRRGFQYVALLTVLVTLAGAAGMYAFEGNATDGFHTYGDSLWWTAMVMTTLGSQAWPNTPEGRILGFLLSLYAFGVFGYITATLATFFVGKEAEDKEGELPSAASIETVLGELRALRKEVESLNREKG